MKKTTRENIKTPYSLHDMNIVSWETAGNDMIVTTQSGMVKTTPPFAQPDGYIKFCNVEWDYSYVYILYHTGNIGEFTGKKMYLKDFVDSFVNSGFSVMDETFGYNMTKFTGYFSQGGFVGECMVEIYHNGDMEYFTKE